MYENGRGRKHVRKGRVRREGECVGKSGLGKVRLRDETGKGRRRTGIGTGKEGRK